jgi:SAM-dependent methyltransferase
MPWLMAALYDRFMRGSEEARLAAWRAELVGSLAGSVIEVGAGTGSNLAHYPDAVTRLALTEPDAAMRRRLQGKLAALGARRGGGVTEVHDARLPRLPFSTGEFDAAVTTLVLCSVREQAPALAELRRVVRPGGTLVFVEHVASERAAPRRWQERLDPLWSRVSGHCHLNRDTARAVAEAGFVIESLTREEHDGLAASLVPMVRGTARAT